MKTKSLLTILSLSLASASFADAIMVNGSFWQAPQETELHLKIVKPVENFQPCEGIRKLLMSERRIRSTIFRELNVGIGELKFQIQGRPGNRFESDARAPEAQTPSAFPHYRQNEATTVFRLSEASNPEYTWSDESLTALALKRNLDQGELTYDAHSRELRTTDLHLYCDIYEGAVSVTLQVPTSVRLKEKDQVILNEFYNNRLLPQLAPVLNDKNKPAVLRAAQLGYRIGKILESEKRSSSISEEKNLISVFEKLIDVQTLETSAQVTKVDKSFYVLDLYEIDGETITASLEF